MATKAKRTAAKPKKSTAKSAARTASPTARKADQTYRASKVHQGAKSVPAGQLPAQFSRADVEFIGVDHSGASYEARVFINNPKADENTPTAETNGYAGSFSVFGHGGCFGDVGHCEIRQEPDEFDPRRSHPLAPIKKVVIATNAIKNAAAQGGDINLTIVPVISGWTEQCDLTDVLRFDHINLVFYD